jgi:hypothetical protein
MLFKRCFKCGAVKALQDFYRHAAMADGHLNKCKGCTKRDVGSYRTDNIERLRAYDRRRGKTPARIAKNRRITSRWMARHPERRRAQVAVNNAVRDGRLVPWPICALPTCDRIPEAHHPDYHQPLDVVWLCPPHHKQAHSKLLIGDRT